MKKLISVLITVFVAISVLSAIWYPELKTKQERKHYPCPYSDIISKYSKEYSVPEEIIYAVIKTESNFKADAVSGAGARGLMQITPPTDEWLSSYYIDIEAGYDIFDPDINIHFGVFYLAYAYSRYGNWETAWASYNAGISRVDSWLADSRYSDDGVILKQIPFSETRGYVKKVSEAVKKYKELYYQI